MNIPEPKYGHHIEDITLLLQRRNLKWLKDLVQESKEHDLTGFIGGPPCPDFSIAGKNKGKEGENGKLSGIYTELICATKPDFFLFENVKGLYRTAKHRAFFEQLKEKLKKAGFVLSERLVNAIEYGVPQDRDRIILIGFQKSKAKQLNLPFKKTELLEFPWEAHKMYSIEQIKECPWPKTSPYHNDIGTMPPEGIIKELTVQYWWEKNDVIHHPNANMYFQPRAALARFYTIEEGDDLKKTLSDYIDGGILQLRLMEIMKFTFIHINQGVFLFQKLLLYNHFQKNLNYQQMFL